MFNDKYKQTLMEEENDSLAVWRAAKVLSILNRSSSFCMKSKFNLKILEQESCTRMLLRRLLISINGPNAIEWSARGSHCCTSRTSFENDTISLWGHECSSGRCKYDFRIVFIPWRVAIWIEDFRGLELSILALVRPITSWLQESSLNNEVMKLFPFYTREWDYLWSYRTEWVVCSTYGN